MPHPAGRRVVAFLGSTIGNLDPQARKNLLDKVRGLLAPDDRLLLGLDLVKDVTALEAAYNDSAGVTAEFNRNILRVVNRAVDADFQPQAFRHIAFYNRHAGRIEMHLAPITPQYVNLTDLETSIRLTADETIWTESSYKFSRGDVERALGDSGLLLEEWFTDSQGRFALLTARPR